MEETKFVKTPDHSLAERIVQGGIPEALKIVAEQQKLIQGQNLTAEQGYSQAYDIITQLRQRLEDQKDEYEKRLEEGFEEAYQMLVAERAKKDELETLLYDEYEIKLQEMKNFIIDKVDQFLAMKAQEIYNHPDGEAEGFRVFRAQNTPEQIVEQAINEPVGEGERWFPPREDELPPNRNQELDAKVRLLEARIMRMSVESQRLAEKVAKLEAAAPKPIMEDVFKGGLLGSIRLGANAENP